MSSNGIAIDRREAVSAVSARARVLVQRLDIRMSEAKPSSAEEQRSHQGHHRLKARILRCIAAQALSEAVERFVQLLQLSDQMLARAEREEIEKCARILTVQCAHCRSKFGEFPISDALDLLGGETMNDEQANWIGDRFEMVVGALGMLEQEHPKH